MTISTRREAARVAGVSPGAVRRWIDQGLPAQDPPWPTSRLTRLGAVTTPAGRPPAEHGTPSGWHSGCDCDSRRDAHDRDNHQRRQARRLREWGDVGPDLLADLARGTLYGRALENAGVTAQWVTARRLMTPEIGEQIDQALMDGRRDDLKHGTDTAWAENCRCPDCREHYYPSSQRVGRYGLP